MCLYVTYPLDQIVVPNTVAPLATEKSGPGLDEYKYVQGLWYAGPYAQTPNGLYAINGPHPSERIIGSNGYADGYLNETDDLRKEHWAMLDATWPIGNSSWWKKDRNFPFTKLEAHATTLYDSVFVGEETQTQHYGWATCENIRVCNRLNGQGVMAEKVGSYCTYTQANGAVRPGYCYEAHDGSLQCGRTTHVSTRFYEVHTEGGHPLWGTNRCPSGTPLTHPGAIVTRRLLIAGCMIASDPAFTAWAEVHVPTMCAVPADFMKGCMFPGARNYAPGSKQSTTCLYMVKGCTSSSALNYNSEAGIDDGSCLYGIPGCTLKEDSDYEGVDPSTPMYKGRWVGLPQNGMGKYVWSGYKTVLNPSPTATVLSGCLVVVEGCMDPTAVNYNSQANVNSNSWCVPKINGCMMPPSLASTPGTHELIGRLHGRDGGAANYNAIATVNTPEACVRGRVGCMSKTAVNYDSRATIPDECFEPTDGCLDRSASNYNCTRKVGFTPCTDASPRATSHVALLCNYGVPPPPAPRPPVIPEGIAKETFVSIAFIASGDVSDFTQERLDLIAGAFAEGAGVDASSVRVIVEPASVSVTVEILVADVDAADAVRLAIADSVATPEAASAFLSAAAIVVVSTPILEVKERLSVTPPNPPPPLPFAAMIGGGIGGTIVIFMCVGVRVLIVRRRRKKKTRVVYAIS